MRKIVKYSVICVAGAILSLILLSLFVEINLRLFLTDSFKNEAWLNASETLWRFNWVFNPIIVILVCLFVAVFEKITRGLFLSLVAIAPLLILNFASSTFFVPAFFFLGFYVAIATLTHFFIKLALGRKSPRSAINETKAQSKFDK